MAIFCRVAISARATVSLPMMESVRLNISQVLYRTVDLRMTTRYQNTSTQQNRIAEGTGLIINATSELSVHRGLSKLVILPTIHCRLGRDVVLHPQ